MWNYYKTVVVNSDVAEDGNPMFSATKVFNPVEGDLSQNAVNVWRNGQYDLSKIGKIYKTVGYKGSRAKMTIPCAGLIAESEGVYDLGLYQLSFKVEMDGKFLSDYASPAYQGFFKPILVGLDVTEERAADPAVLAKYIGEQIELALPENNKFIKVSVDGSDVVIEATDDYMFFKEENVKFEKYEVVGCDTCLGEYIPKPIKPDVVANKQPFATGEWIYENLRLPNTLNFRYFGSNDEMPVKGLVYTQYTFELRSDRPGLGGHSGVGQGIEAITTHTFYCANGAAAEAFETAFADVAGGIVETPNSEGKLYESEGEIA